MRNTIECTVCYNDAIAVARGVVEDNNKQFVKYYCPTCKTVVTVYEEDKKHEVQKQ